MSVSAGSSSRFTEPLEPTLPNNLAAEKSVLGAILLDNARLPEASRRLKSGDFGLDQHQQIFRCMVEMGEAQQSIDLVTICDQLERKGHLEACGGNASIAQLVDGVPRVSNVEHYARIVKEKSVLRILIHEMRNIRQSAFEGEDVATILARASETFSRIAGDANGSARGENWRDIFHSFADFENAAPLTFAIKGFLQNNGATMIGGLSGHGKTLILLSIAKALLIGKGSILWKYFPVEETAIRVIYLIPEASIEPFKHRLRLFGLYEYLAPDDERLLVRTLSMGPTPCLSDPRILYAAKGAHVVLDTAVRFSTDGDENSAADNQRGLATDIFALLGAGARSVIGAHHSPKPFARENVMRLENVLRGSGDIGAMLTTAWGIKQVDAARNILHIENIKPRDFQPPPPFQIIGRPFIDEMGDFELYKKPGECGSLMDEQQRSRDKGGAPKSADRQERVSLVKNWLSEEPELTIKELRLKFKLVGIDLSDPAVKKYKRDANGS
jgi:hypothetical protein